jgi:hypothetical protein
MSAIACGRPVIVVAGISGAIGRFAAFLSNTCRASAAVHSLGTSLASPSGVGALEKEVAMSLVNRSLVLAALLLGATGGQAYAKDVVDVQVPFDFQLGNQTFHAGQYEVVMSNAGDGVMSLRGDHGKTFAFALTIPADGQDPAGHKPALVFSRRENRYVLSQIWENGSEGQEIVQE